MSVQSEITRLKNAKAAIKAAIEGKGVTVPDATLLDGMASLIESIEAGGGGGELITGTFTLASSTAAPTLDYHASSVDEWPSWLIVIAEKDSTTEYSEFNSVWVSRIVYSDVVLKRNFFSYNYSCILYGYNQGLHKYYTPYLASGSIELAQAISVNPGSFNSKFLAGITYRYYMYVG